MLYTETTTTWVCKKLGCNWKPLKHNNYIKALKKHYAPKALNTPINIRHWNVGNLKYNNLDVKKTWV
jgi:hypothetical protein